MAAERNPKRTCGRFSPAIDRNSSRTTMHPAGDTGLLTTCHKRPLPNAPGGIN